MGFLSHVNQNDPCLSFYSSSIQIDLLTRFLQKSAEGDILPLILDPSQSPISASDLVERVHHEGGLLANTGLSAVLLSMSSYNKTYAEPEGNFGHSYYPAFFTNDVFFFQATEPQIQQTCILRMLHRQ